MTIEPSPVTVVMGAQVQLVAKGATGAVEWSSSNTAIATVSFGLVSGVGGGVATITATSGSQHAEVSVTVRRPATLATSTSLTPFTAAAQGAVPAAQQLSISSGGDEPAAGLASQVEYTGGGATGWLSVSALSSNTTPATITVQPNTTNLASGTYSANLRISSTNATNSPLILPVTFNVGALPEIALSSASVQFAAQATGATPNQQSVVITNGGPAGSAALSGLSVGSIAYGAGATDWLNAAISPSTAPTTLALQPKNTSLSVGTYTATVQVVSSLSGVAPKTVNVTYQLTSAPPGPGISLAVTQVAFQATSGGGTPSPRTVGIENSGGGTLSGLSVASVTYGAGATDWLAASISPSTAPTNLTLQPKNTSLGAGTYTATVQVASSLSGVTPKTVSVSYELGTAQVGPIISLTPTQLTFDATSLAAIPAAKTVAMENGGGGVLTGVTNGSIVYGPGATDWLNLTWTASAAPATLTVQPKTTALSAGTYTATIPVTSNLAGVASKSVSVTYTVGTAATISLSQTTVTFAAVGGGATPTAKTVTITNSGGGTLTGLTVPVTYLQGANWLTATLSQPNATSVLTLQINSVLSPGTYNADVKVTSAVASNSPQTVHVTYTVDPPPNISLSTQTVAFNTSAPNALPNPASTAISITNTGGGTLTNLQAQVIATNNGQLIGTPFSGWLQTSLSGTTGSPTLTLSVTQAPPFPDTYTATVRVSATGATSKDITVTYKRVATLTNDVQSIFTARCADCHSTATHAGNVILATVTNSYNSLVGAASTNRPDLKRVNAAIADPDQSYLYLEITGRAVPPHNMPPTCTANTPCIPLAEVNMIQMWIREGARQ